jgi:hypothetical protein
VKGAKCEFSSAIFGEAKKKTLIFPEEYKIMNLLL